MSDNEQDEAIALGLSVGLSGTDGIPFVAPDPGSTRITEGGDRRITEDGNVRVIE